MKYASKQVELGIYLPDPSPRSPEAAHAPLLFLNEGSKDLEHPTNHGYVHGWRHLFFGLFLETKGGPPTSGACPTSVCTKRFKEDLSVHQT